MWAHHFCRWDSELDGKERWAEHEPECVPTRILSMFLTACDWLAQDPAILTHPSMTDCNPKLWDKINSFFPQAALVRAVGKQATILRKKNPHKIKQVEKLNGIYQHVCEVCGVPVPLRGFCQWRDCWYSDWWKLVTRLFQRKTKRFHLIATSTSARLGEMPG